MSQALRVADKELRNKVYLDEMLSTKNSAETGYALEIEFEKTDFAKFNSSYLPIWPQQNTSLGKIW